MLRTDIRAPRLEWLASEQGDERLRDRVRHLFFEFKFVPLALEMTDGDSGLVIRRDEDHYRRHPCGNRIVSAVVKDPLLARAAVANGEYPCNVIRIVYA